MAINIEFKLSPEQQLENKIFNGFPQALGKNADEYRQDFSGALARAKLLQEKMGNSGFGSVSIIEPRIPFGMLLNLQGLDLDPAVFYTPRNYPKAHPYAVWTKTFSDRSSLPASFRYALPLEGIQMNEEAALQNSTSLALLGGGYEKTIYAPDKNRLRILVIERYFDKYRISQIYNHELDGRAMVVGCLSSKSV